MRITIERTDDLLELDGVPVRRWDGVLESGARVHVLVHRLAADDPQAQAELEAAAHEQLPPGSLNAAASRRDGIMVQIGIGLGSELAGPGDADVREALRTDRELGQWAGETAAMLSHRLAGLPERTRELEQQVLDELVGLIRTVARDPRRPPLDSCQTGRSAGE